MNTLQITKILKNHKTTKESFLCCTSSDRIPTSDIYPYSCVVNTDDSSRPGEHWIAIYVPNSKVVEYFDSLAFEPNRNIQKYLEKFETVVQNNTPLQNPFSNSCGAFTIYFLIKRASGISFEDIIKNLISKNDADKFVKSCVLRGSDLSGWGNIM